MRIDGKLAKWNDDRGFGFINALQGGPEVFVHIFSFPRASRRPRLNELLSLEVEVTKVEVTKAGKKRAIRVQRPQRQGARQNGDITFTPKRNTRSLRNGVIACAILLSLGVYGYSRYSNYVRIERTAITTTASEPRESLVAPAPTPIVDARCDGRIYCSQMTSCSEAKFFLQSCPGTQMDGNHDGIPCESQWCKSPFAK